MQSLYGTQTGVNLARKHIGWYTKGLGGSAEFRNKVNTQDDPKIVIADASRLLFALAFEGLRPNSTNCVLYATRPC